MSSTSPKSTRLLLTRHGETPGSRDDRFCGSIEVPLTELGHAQAEALAARLSHEHIDALYCSPQQRTLATAAPIASAPGLEIQQRAALREMNFGQWENRRRADLEKEDPEAMEIWQRGSWLSCPPDGESQQAVIARVVPCIIELLTAHSGQTLLIVSHRTTLRLLIGHLLGMNLSSSRFLGLNPASLSELHINQDQVQLISSNDTSHLVSLETTNRKQ